jgi:hypothetical protein
VIKTADIGVGIDLEPGTGIQSTPWFIASWNGTQFAADFYPLGDSTSDLDIVLLPPAGVSAGVKAASGALDKFLFDWIIPVAASLVIEKEQSALSKHLWTSGPTGQDLVDASGVLAGKTLLQMATGLLGALAKNADLAIGNFHLQFVNPNFSNNPQGYGYGVMLSGFADIPAGSLTVSARFGIPMSSPPWFKKGVTLYLFDSSFNFVPFLSVKGLGVGLASSEGPLINTSYLRF